VISWFRKLLGSGLRSADTLVPPAPEKTDHIAELESFIGRLVAAGYESPQEILQSAADYIGDDLDPRVVDEKVGPMLERAIAAHAAAEAKWPPATDYDRLNAAFASLERNGVVARENFTCCGTCGSAEIWEEIDAARDAGHAVQGYAFFHMQDTESAVDGDGLYLNYGAVEEGEAAALEVGTMIVSEIERNGLKIDWDGSWDKRIGVSLDWKRRRDRASIPRSNLLH
jgi:hypothetical protein